MKFQKLAISGYPFYRVWVEGVILGYVEKDALGEGWWGYQTYPNSDATRCLHATRRDAAECLDSRALAEKEKSL